MDHDHPSPLERGPLRGYWTEETGTTKSKSNEVVVRIQEKYRVAGPRLARPRLLLDHSQQDICIGKILLLRNSRLRVTKTHRFILPPEILCPIKITTRGQIDSRWSIALEYVRIFQFVSYLMHRDESQIVFLLLLLPLFFFFSFFSFSVKIRKTEAGTCE